MVEKLMPYRMPSQAEIDAAYLPVTADIRRMLDDRHRQAVEIVASGRTVEFVIGEKVVGRIDPVRPFRNF